MRAKALGFDPKTGLVHYDSYAKVTYIWPLCRTPYLNLDRYPPTCVVTCLECLVNYVKYDWANR